jgi:hypothetical protein
MQMGIAAPLLAMEARGASPEELETAAFGLAKVQFPPEKLTDLKGKAKKYCTDNSCDGFSETDYGNIALVLWAYFTDAVERGGAKVPTTKKELFDLLDAAYEAQSKNGKSGEIIARNSKDWEKDWEHVTNYCAYRCGLHAADIAKTGNTITPDNYRAAFQQTSVEIKTLVIKIVRNGKEKEIKGGGC